MPFEFEAAKNSSSKKTPWDKIAEQVPFLSAFRRRRGRIVYEVKSREDQKQDETIIGRKSDKVGKLSENNLDEQKNRQDSELIAIMDQYRDKKTKEIRADRSLELTERKFNEVMITPDELSEAVLFGEEGISMNEMKYEGKKVQVYELEGYPIRFLQHVVDYRSEDGQVGINTSREILKNPSKWVSDIEEMRRRNNRNVDMMADNVSTSYVDADINLARGGGCHSKAGVTYGFCHIPGNSLIILRNGDAGTSQKAATNRSEIEKYKDPTEFASCINDYRDPYNEVVLRRYSENGQPILPDFMIVHDRGIDKRNDQLTEATLRHATYFNIPIVRIHDEAYKEKALKKIIGNIEKLDENVSYQELYSILLSANKSNMLPNDIYTFRQNFTSKEPEPTYSDRHSIKILPEHIRDKFIHLVAKVEPVRRLDYIERCLSNRGENNFANVSIVLTTTEIGTGEHYIPIYGEQIHIDMPGTPKTVIRSDNPEYPRIKKAIDKFISLGGTVRDDRIRQT